MTLLSAAYVSITVKKLSKPLGLSFDAALPSGKTSPGGATLSNKMNNTVHYGHVRHTLALMCAKNHLLTFSSFLDIWENAEWPRFFGPPCRFMSVHIPLAGAHGRTAIAGHFACNWLPASWALLVV